MFLSKPPDQNTCVVFLQQYKIMHIFTIALPLSYIRVNRVQSPRKITEFDYFCCSLYNSVIFIFRALLESSFINCPTISNVHDLNGCENLMSVIGQLTADTRELGVRYNYLIQLTPDYPVSNAAGIRKLLFIRGVFSGVIQFDNN